MPVFGRREYRSYTAAGAPIRHPLEWRAMLRPRLGNPAPERDHTASCTGLIEPGGNA